MSPQKDNKTLHIFDFTAYILDCNMHESGLPCMVQQIESVINNTLGYEGKQNDYRRLI